MSPLQGWQEARLQCLEHGALVHQLYQTRCVGHGRVWLETDGHCRRTGQTCERLDAPLHAKRLHAVDGFTENGIKLAGE